MIDEDTLIGLVKDSFSSDTRAVVASPHLVADIRGRVRRRWATIGTAAGTAVMAIGVSVVAQHPWSTPTRSATSGDTAATKVLRLSGHTFTIPASARTTDTCLHDVDKWLAGLTANPSAPESMEIINNLSGATAGEGSARDCIRAAFTYATSVPNAIDMVTATGKKTVRFAAPTGNNLIAYVALDAEDSAAAAQSNGGPTGITYYLIGEIPSDNDRSVLVSMLQADSLRQIRFSPSVVRPTAASGSPAGPPTSVSTQNVPATTASVTPQRKGVRGARFVGY